MGKKSRVSSGQASPLAGPDRARSPSSACASRARAGPASGTRPATAARSVPRRVRLVTRPFEGLPGEGDWVAMREIVPAATATVRTTAEHGAPRGHRRHRAAHGMAGACAAPTASVLRRPPDAGRFRRRRAGTPRHALLAALAAEPGTPVGPGELPGRAPGCRTCSSSAPPFEVAVHAGFDFWLAGVDDDRAEVRESMERANAAVVPTRRLRVGRGGLLVRDQRAPAPALGARRTPRTRLLDGLARLHAADRSSLGRGLALRRGVPGRRARSSRCGTSPRDARPSDLEEPAVAFAPAARRGDGRHRRR